MNPFKFGTVVDDPYFINRKKELDKIRQILESENHLTVISPRRYGKTSLIRKALAGREKQTIYLDMQLIVSPGDLAAQLLKRVFRISPFNRIKNLVKSFRIVPVLSINPAKGETEVTFKTDSKSSIPLEDVLSLLNDIGSRKKRIVAVFDEFQEIFRIDSNLDRIMRAVMQNHNNVNYIFSGSSESMMRDIFSRKKSPFYHFALPMNLGLIPENEFAAFLSGHFRDKTMLADRVASDILSFTNSHPYYTQQLAYIVWQLLIDNKYSDETTTEAIEEIIQNQDNNYERLWNTLNKTDMKVMIGMSGSELEPMSKSFSSEFDTGSDSTVYSSLQRLTKKGILIKDRRSYIIDDPFFKKWIIQRRKL